MIEKLPAKKSLGQHFLTGPIIPRLMIEAGEVEVGDTVVEIGPGLGVLTNELLISGAKVIAYETDRRAIATLNEGLADYLAKSRLILHQKDVRELTPDDPLWPQETYKVIANIPYYLTGFLLRLFLTAQKQPQTLVFLVQKEVAKRITAKTGGKESLLSLSVKAYGRPRYVKTVGKNHFQPPPKIDSAIVVVEDINRERLGGIDEEQFFNLLHLGFGQKRKQLISNLVRAGYKRELIAKILDALKLPTKVRAEDLDLDNWLNLARQLRRL